MYTIRYSVDWAGQLPPTCNVADRHNFADSTGGDNDNFSHKRPFLIFPYPFDHLMPSLSGKKKVVALPLQSALQVASKLFAQFRCKLFSPTNHGCIAFRQFTQFRVGLSSLTCIWPTKATLTTRGNPFILECISQLTNVLSVIQASRLNCTLHFLCVLKVSEVPRRSLNLHFLNSPESQTKDKFILIDHHLQLIPNIIDVNIFWDGFLPWHFAHYQPLFLQCFRVFLYNFK